MLRDASRMKVRSKKLGMKRIHSVPVAGAGDRQLGMLEKTGILGGVPRRHPNVILTDEQQHRLRGRISDYWDEVFHPGRV
jgi:hypothetical protein